MTAQAPPHACANCGERVAARYCPDCGQALADPRAGFRVLLREFFEGALGYDSALRRTVVPLFLQPGRLTRDYLDGRRHRYYSPLRFYLFCSILMLLFLDLRPVAQPAAGEKDVTFNIADEDPFDPDSLLGKWLNGPIERQVERLEALDPDLAEVVIFYQAASAVPKALFILLPLIALWMRLLLLRTGSLYFDHFIFALHAQSFLFLAITVLGRFLEADTILALSFPVLAVYWYAGLRRVYGIGRLRTVLTLPLLGLLVFATAAAVAGGVMLWAVATV